MRPARAVRAGRAPRRGGSGQQHGREGEDQDHGCQEHQEQHAGLSIAQQFGAVPLSRFVQSSFSIRLRVMRMVVRRPMTEGVMSIAPAGGKPSLDSHRESCSGTRRPSHQPEAPSLARLPREWLDGFAAELRALGLEVHVHP